MRDSVSPSSGCRFIGWDSDDGDENKKIKLFIYYNKVYIQVSVISK